jgi:uncharacterized protein (DUF1697 family)
MISYVALLRAVNVGGTGALPMTILADIGREAGFTDVRTYIASGNLLFRSPQAEPVVKRALEARLADHAGRAVGVLVRTAAELAGVLAANPFADRPANQVAAIFLDQPPSPTLWDGITGQAADEAIELGRREIYVHYGSGMGRTKLRIPAAAAGTARNMNTVAKLVELATS